MQKTFINLTPHAINFTNGLTVPPSGTVARCRVQQQEIGSINGVPLYRAVYGEVEGLPKVQDGVIYIVSSLVAGRLPERGDLVVPCNFVRDEKGRIIGAGGIQRI